MKNTIYLLIGLSFGIILIQSEAASWYRIQEMFRFQSFHMYGIIGTSILIGLIGKYLLRRYHVKSFSGKEIIPGQKKYHHGLIIGGFAFGIGWGLTGVCPGPLYALIGNGFMALILLLISALAGTWVYSYFREKLPH